MQVEKLRSVEARHPVGTNNRLFAILSNSAGISANGFCISHRSGADGIRA
jgi:hypothetical protein